MKIYGFLYEDETGMHCFYIGRTNNIQRRLREHQRLVKNPNAKDAHLLKYVECRALEARGIQWTMQELGEVGPDEYEIDSEKAMVIEMVLAGHKLTNMKHGDVTKSRDLAELEDMIAKGVRTVSEVRQYREEKERVTKENQELRAARLAERIRKQQEQERLEAEMRAKMTARDIELGEMRAKRAVYLAEQNKRLEQSNRELAEREAEKNRQRKIREDQRNLEIAEHRKQQQAQWEIDNAHLVEERRRARETEEGIKSIQAWRAELFGIKGKTK